MVSIRVYAYLSDVQVLDVCGVHVMNEPTRPGFNFPTPPSRTQLRVFCSLPHKVRRRGEGPHSGRRTSRLSRRSSSPSLKRELLWDRTDVTMRGAHCPTPKLLFLEADDPPALVRPRKLSDTGGKAPFRGSAEKLKLIFIDGTRRVRPWARAS